MNQMIDSVVCWYVSWLDSFIACMFSVEHCSLRIYKKESIVFTSEFAYRYDDHKNSTGFEIWDKNFLNDAK